MIRTSLGIVAAVCLWVSGALGEAITLAKDGKPAATIVLPKDPPARVAAAAAELRKYVERISGVALPIRRDGQPVAGTGLYIGQCEITTEADLPDRKLNPETYAIRVRGGNVLLTGRRPTPTYFAVASFLEDDLGVRWFAPGELWEHVPTGKPGELAVDVTERVRVPDTSPRVWSGHAWFPSWQTWNLRNKTVLSEVVPRRQFQNFLHRVFPPAKYARTHPEYYPLIGHKRWIPTGGTHWRPCESNPDVLRLTVAYARKWFDAHPTIDSFSLGMDDISHLCGCPKCRAMDPAPGSYERREFSDRHYKFVNAVAREIRKTHPDRYVGTLIYNIARRPPKTVPKLEDNVFGFITETSALWWQPGRKQADHEVTREWARRCKHLSRYDYFGMGTFTPRVYPHTIAEQIQFDKSLGLEGMYTEVYTFLPHTAPMIWAFAKLQWDSRLDVDKLLWEFYSKMYGPAAPVMKEYFDLLERSWNTPRPGRDGWVHRSIVRQALAMSPEDVDAGFKLLDKAASAAAEGPAKRRIGIHRAALRYASYAIYAYGISRQLLATPVSDEKSAQEALGRIEKLSALAAEREKFWASAPKRDDLLGETLRGLGGKKYLTIGHVGKVEQGALIGVMRVLAWHSRHAPGKLGAVAERLSRPGSGSAGQMAKAWLWLQKAERRSLLVNGDFEDTAPNRGTPEKDWKTTGTPKGWSTWSRTPKARFAVPAGKGQNGRKPSAAASIAGASAACYLQTVRVKPGERYLCVAWVRADPPDRPCGGRLTVRLRDRKGGWHPRHDLEPSVSMVPGPKGWQPLAVLVAVPDGAGGLVVMPGAQGQADNARALFDNVALYKLPQK